MQELGYHKHFDPAYIEERMRHAKSAPRYRRRLARKSSAEEVDNGTYTEKMIASKCPFQYRQDSIEEASDTGDNVSSSAADTDSGEQWYHPSDDIPTGEGICDDRVGYLRLMNWDYGGCCIVITVFSAPNYCDRYANKGAILKIGMGAD